MLSKTNMSQVTRYQAAIMRDEEILLIKHQEHKNGRAYWVLPGGGIENGETEVQCVRREVQEETNLEIEVVELLLDEPPQHEEKGVYQRFKTFLCHPITIAATPGYEPEPEAAAKYAITDVGWYNIRDETTWDQLIVNDPITAPGLRRIRAALKQRELCLEKVTEGNDIERDRC
jgi:ADP-ribose pyrophosphatase YjhB (NUDIX family)